MYFPQIKNLREDNDKSQKDIAIILQTTQRQYSRWETGIYSIPIEKMIILANYYNVSMDYICSQTNKKERK